MSEVTTVGIDLAKNVFQVHGVDDRGKTVLRKQLRRNQVAEFFANRSPRLIGMEACASAHYWARKLGEFSHTVKPHGAAVCQTLLESNSMAMANGMPAGMALANGAPGANYTWMRPVVKSRLRG
jgi:hypothetical protein